MFIFPGPMPTAPIAQQCTVFLLLKVQYAKLNFLLNICRHSYQQTDMYLILFDSCRIFHVVFQNLLQLLKLFPTRWAFYVVSCYINSAKNTDTHRSVLTWVSTSIQEVYVVKFLWVKNLKFLVQEQIHIFNLNGH